MGKGGGRGEGTGGKGRGRRGEGREMLHPVSEILKTPLPDTHCCAIEKEHFPIGLSCAGLATVCAVPEREIWRRL